MTELREEWKFGRGLKPPVKGTKWRAPQERGWFQRRQKLIDELYTIARESLQAEEIIAKDLEDIRVKGRHTLKWICDNWVKQNRRARVTVSVSLPASPDWPRWLLAEFRMWHQGPMHTP